MASHLLIHGRQSAHCTQYIRQYIPKTYLSKLYNMIRFAHPSIVVLCAKIYTASAVATQHMIAPPANERNAMMSEKRYASYSQKRNIFYVLFVIFYYFSCWFSSTNADTNHIHIRNIRKGCVMAMCGRHRVLNKQPFSIDANTLLQRRLPFGWRFIANFFLECHILSILCLFISSKCSYKLIFEFACCCFMFLCCVSIAFAFFCSYFIVSEMIFEDWLKVSWAPICTDKRNAYWSNKPILIKMMVFNNRFAWQFHFHFNHFLDS